MRKNGNRWILKLLKEEQHVLKEAYKVQSLKNKAGITLPAPSFRAARNYGAQA